jgi:uncharacterized protein YdeI (YjbR/CyaY-like superfamily)
MQKNIELYFIDGCGRCALHGTPQCKVVTWYKELALLRSIIQECGLIEVVKWGCPCYTFNNKNIIMLAAFKDFAFISFFKGEQLQDTHNLLVKTGENTQSGRLLKFTDVKIIYELKDIIKAYIYEAIEIEKSDVKVEPKVKNALIYPEELIKILDENLELKRAFEALSPGRQRGYNLFFTAPKQSATRTSRILKCVDMIISGKGLHD